MRPSGRDIDQMRQVTILPNFNKHAEGSCLIKFGDTHVICTASVEEKLPAWLGGARSNLQRCGLALGQSIFWNTWDKYINGNTDDAEVISEAAVNVQKLLKVWSDL